MDDSHTSERLEKGAARERQGDLNGALTHYTDALAANPDSVPVLLATGAILFQMGNSPDAAQHLDKAVRLDPSHVIAHNILGLALATMGQMAPAREQFQKAVKIRPDYADAQFNLGLSYAVEKRWDEAAAAYVSGIRAAPSNPDGYARLFQVMSAKGALEEAEQTAARWVKCAPGQPEPLVERARVLTVLGRYDEADVCYDEALKANSGHVEATAGKAELLERKGDTDAAWERVSPLTGPDIKNATAAFVFGSLSHRIDRQDEALSLIKRAIIEGWDGGQTVRLHHKAGEMLDRMGDFNQAFSHFRSGNNLAKQATEPYDPAAHTGWIDRVIQTFTPELMTKRERPSDASEVPIFIVGMPRSGTSLVEQIIASHPQAYGAGELPHIKRLSRRVEEMSGAAFPECMSGLDANTLDELAAGQLAVLEQMAPNAGRVSDKMPHNFLYLGLIAMLFPGARIVHTMRDARDTCLSCYTQSFPALSYTCDLSHLGHFYGQYLRLMDHWRTVLPIPMLDLSYEELVADQEPMSRKLIDFLGLEWDEACLSPHKTKRQVTTASYEQVRRPVYQGSVARWRRYEQHLKPLFSALGMDDGE